MSGHGTFRGVTSSYLTSRIPGDSILCFVRPTKVPFQLPSNPETPVIMVAAGTGIAPMRAFCQERAVSHRAGQHKLGPALLFSAADTPRKSTFTGQNLKLGKSKVLWRSLPVFHDLTMKATNDTPRMRCGSNGNGSGRCLVQGHASTRADARAPWGGAPQQRGDESGWRRRAKAKPRHLSSWIH